MDVRLSDDEHLLREQVRRVADEAAPLSELLARTDEDERKLLDLAHSLGWADPDDDLTLVQRTILLLETGRTLFPDALHTALAARTVVRALAVAGDGGAIAGAAGTARLGLAFLGAGGGPTELSLNRTDGAATISGVASHVADYAASERLLVLAHDEAENQPAAAVIATGGQAAVTAIPDIGRRDRSRVAWDGQPVLASIAGPRVEAAFVAAVVLAEIADTAGMLRRILEIGVDHAQNRVQFGRPIGSFQAIQHRLADAALHADGAELWTFRIAAMIESGNIHRPYIRAGLGWVREAAVQVESAVHQVTAGVGFTVEHPLHRFFWRLKTRVQSTRFAVDAWAGEPSAAAFTGGAFADYIFDAPVAATGGR